MLQAIIDMFKRLFGITPRLSQTDAETNKAAVAQYEDIRNINLPYIIANRLSNVTISDSTIEVTGTSDRAVFLNASLQRVILRLKLITARAFGIGGVVLKPYTFNGQIYTDILTQDRFFVVERKGEVITSAGFVADIVTMNYSKYIRFEHHTLSDDGVYTIENKATKDGKPSSLSVIPDWANIEPIITISGVEKMLFSFVKCPIDSKKLTTDLYGVPITYGNDKLISEILFLLDEMQEEYVNKRAFIGADEVLFNKDNRLPKSGLYKLFRANGGIDNKAFWEVFSPDIRTQSYIDGINYRMGLLEKSIGVNKGILTDLDTADATATAIKRSTFDTFNLVDAMRGNLEVALDRLVYSFDVYTNALSLAPTGDYKITYDWSYSLLEDSAETFQQKLAAVGAGALNGWELRQWLTDEDEETAKANMPDTLDLTGTVNVE